MSRLLMLYVLSLALVIIIWFLAGVHYGESLSQQDYCGKDFAMYDLERCE